MIHEDGRLVLSAGSDAAGAGLYTQSWRPEGTAQADILLLHGYAEHSGRYTHVAEHCIARGYAVHTLDHWGHGKSDGESGFVESFDVFVDGALARLEQVRAADADRPIFLVGHSMGGVIACHVLLARQSAFAGAVFSGPAIRPAELPSGFMMAMARTASKFAPRMGVMDLAADGVSSDPEVVRDYENDPLNYHGKVGARLGYELLTAGQAAEARAGEITLPMLILHGDADVLAAPEGAQALYDGLGSTDKALKFYPGLYHEIFNEPERDAVLRDMTDWLSGHIAP